MIVVQTCGGLGNQLFQYALGRALSERLDVPLYLDIQRHQSRHHRDFILSNFQIKAEILPRRKVKRLVNPKFWRCPKLETVVEQTPDHFDPQILDLPPNVYLQGYWQTPMYFASIDHLIRDELQLKLPQQGKNLEIAQEIAGHNSVSLHIRRGDYVTNPNCYVMPIDYYHQAVSKIAEQVDNPYFYIFSNDPTWVKENLHLPLPSYIVDHNDEAAGHEDLRLMSQCKHHIMANSTFSWWAGYLNPNPNKIIYMPKRCDQGDFIPPSWNLL